MCSLYVWWRLFGTYRGVTVGTCTQSPELTALRVKYTVEAADRVAARQDQGVSDEQGDVHLHLSTNILNNPFIVKE